MKLALQNWTYLRMEYMYQWQRTEPNSKEKSLSNIKQKEGHIPAADPWREPAIDQPRPAQKKGCRTGPKPELSHHSSNCCNLVPT